MCNELLFLIKLNWLGLLVFPHMMKPTISIFLMIFMFVNFFDSMKKYTDILTIWIKRNIKKSMSMICGLSCVNINTDTGHLTCS